MKTLKTQLKNRKTIIRLFSALVLVVGFALVATSCCKEDIPAPKPEKVIIMFGVEQGDGELRATVDGKQIASRTEIEKGKTVVFEAVHSKSWKIKSWKINGVLIRSVETIQTFENVTDHMDVRVAFKPYGSIPTE